MMICLAMRKLFLCFLTFMFFHSPSYAESIYEKEWRSKKEEFRKKRSEILNIFTKEIEIEEKDRSLRSNFTKERGECWNIKPLTWE